MPQTMKFCKRRFAFEDVWLNVPCESVTTLPRLRSAPLEQFGVLQPGRWLASHAFSCLRSRHKPTSRDGCGSEPPSRGGPCARCRSPPSAAPAADGALRSRPCQAIYPHTNPFTSRAVTLLPWRRRQLRVCSQEADTPTAYALDCTESLSANYKDFFPASVAHAPTAQTRKQRRCCLQEDELLAIVHDVERHADGLTAAGVHDRRAAAGRAVPQVRRARAHTRAAPFSTRSTALARRCAEGRRAPRRHPL